MSSVEDGARSGTLRATLCGFTAFAVGAGAGIGLGLAEYGATSGAYRLWTWIKVGFLYLVSFCGAGVHVDAVGGSPLASSTDVDIRVPFLLGTIVVAGILFLVGRSLFRARVVWTAWIVAVAAFTLPVLAVSVPASLEFPTVGIRLSAIPWQAAAFAAGLAGLSLLAGALSGAKTRLGARGSWGLRASSALTGGWRMFSLAMWFSLIAFLALAAVKLDVTKAYVRTLVDAGTTGAVVGGHHALLLPNQSAFLLAVSSGAAVEANAATDEDAARLTLQELRVGPDARVLTFFIAFFTPFPDAPPGEPAAVHLGGGYYFLLLVPALATFLGGRRAAQGWRMPGERAIRGALAGLVYTVLVVGVSIFASIRVAAPIFEVLPITIWTPPLLLALASAGWGVVGGVLGALSSDSRR
jgi:hypothetical protein